MVPGSTQAHCSSMLERYRDDRFAVALRALGSDKAGASGFQQVAVRSSFPSDQLSVASADQFVNHQAAVESPKQMLVWKDLECHSLRANVIKDRKPAAGFRSHTFKYRLMLIGVISSCVTFACL